MKSVVKLYIYNKGIGRAVQWKNKTYHIAINLQYKKKKKKNPRNSF